MSEEERVRYWEAGAAAIRSLGGPYQYGCPLCLRLFPRDQIGHLSLDHVPPESVGGKLEVLTCRACNSTAGAELDSHAFGVERIRRLFAGEPYPPVATGFRFDGVTANMELRSDSAACHEILGLPACNPPGVLDEVTAVFDDHVRAGTTPSIEFTMPKLRCSEQRARVSYLRAGYLAAFAVFGYTAIAPQSFGAVRQQIREPHVKHLRFFFHRRDDFHGHWVAVVEEPSWHVSIVVLMGNFLITLPLSGDAGLYERIAEKAAIGVQLNLQCRRFEWPRWPVYLRDRKLARADGTGDTPLTGPVG
jgi:HNH endonuclease